MSKLPFVETLEHLKAAHRPAPDDKKVTTRSVKVPKRISDGPKIFALCNFKLQEETDDAKVKEVLVFDSSSDHLYFEALLKACILSCINHPLFL